MFIVTNYSFIKSWLSIYYGPSEAEVDAGSGQFRVYHSQWETNSRNIRKSGWCRRLGPAQIRDERIYIFLILKLTDTLLTTDVQKGFLRSKKSKVTLVVVTFGAVADSSPAQGKVIGHSLLADWQSMTRITGQLREEVRPCPDHNFHSQGQETSLTTHVQKTSWMSNEVMPREAHHPQSFVGEFILAKRWAHMGGSWDTSNTDCEPEKSKWLAKGNQKKCPHKYNSNYH